MRIHIQVGIFVLGLLLSGMFSDQTDAQTVARVEGINFQFIPVGNYNNNFLASFGITLEIDPSGQPSVQPESAGINPGGGHFFVVTNTVPNNTVTMSFDPPIYTLHFDRIGTLAGHALTPAWTVQVFDTMGTEVNSFSETAGHRPARRFFFAASAPELIGSIVFTTMNTGTPFDSVPLDNFRLFRYYCNNRGATIVGTNASDVLIGTHDDDVIVALNGNDEVRGRRGNDTICGGSGNDILRGGKGNDVIFGEGQDDTIDGGANEDTIDGGRHNDRLFGNIGNDILFGGNDNDYLMGSLGGDLLSGGRGDDRLHGGQGTDTCIGDDEDTSFPQKACEE